MFATLFLDPWTYALILLFPAIGVVIGILKTIQGLREDPKGSTYWGHRWQRNFLDHFLDR